MTNALAPLLADTIRTTFEWGRIQSNVDWIAPVAACVAVLFFVQRLYQRDAIELGTLWSWTLTAMRSAAFLGLLIVYLQPHWRSEREDVRNSRVLLLADTSLSMALPDGESVSSASNSRGPTARGKGASDNSNTNDKPPRGPLAPGYLSRAHRLASALKESDFLARLRKTHDVAVFIFADDLNRNSVVTLGKEKVQEKQLESSKPPVQEPIDWPKLLTPTGAETRLGQALRQVIQEERGTPISGVVVFSDGGQNAGIAPEAAAELAREAKIPIFTVGLGSDRRPTHVAISDFVVPARAYPGDHYTVTGYLQAQGLAGKAVAVRVLSRAADNGENINRNSRGPTARGKATGDNSHTNKETTRGALPPGYLDKESQVLETRQVVLGGDGEVLPVKFEIAPGAVGRRTLSLQVVSPEGDTNPADSTREADIEIVDRKNRVLLMADGPMREYQFLRNQLFRDRYTTVDVWLQSAKPGISQEAKRTLDDFPTTREEMADYDCVVAFDPNWQALKPAQLELLEKWVSQQGGGLIVVAGPVNACRGAGGWTQDPAMNAVRMLYPVEFPGRLATIDSNMVSSREPCPLQFTREGQEADFLWLADTATASRQAWAAFPGVYSYCPVRGPKAGATVYARVADPHAPEAGNQTVYFAGQFYGSGSVFYMGSGEMWRLRAIDEADFEQLYTKLVRHVSQGRLLRGSSRGVLLVGQDRYMLGNTVEVRAQLTNIRLEPLASPTVSLQIVQPDGAARTFVMRADRGRPGAYVGQFPALQEGTYRLELPVPESQNERLSRRIQVKAPDLERENPQRNDALLSSLARGTGGTYYVGMSSALATGGKSPLVEQLKDRTTTVILPVAPNPQHEENWLFWVMVGLCGLLCCEWLVRRLLKLA